MPVGVLGVSSVLANAPSLEEVRSPLALERPRMIRLVCLSNPLYLRFPQGRRACCCQGGTPRSTAPKGKCRSFQRVGQPL